ncbi:MAG: cryptochrome/photolyase family protein [Leptospiraceae bacterium]|nr:cryptochrome/photolyase family protein [Leptospiraceae bacterium]
MNLILILGNQLFPISLYKKYFSITENSIIFMREDIELCTYYKFHKHKIIFFLSAMRKFKEEWARINISIHYEFLNQDKLTYEKSLINFINKNKIRKVTFFEIEDKFFESRIINLLKNNNIQFEIKSSPMFMTSREDFQKYLENRRKPFLKVFYELQRKRWKILLTIENKPIGGKWSFDSENRKPLPKNLSPPPINTYKPDNITNDVIKIVDNLFQKHPGSGENFYLPTDNKGARKWLKEFLIQRLEKFGPYEDALSEKSDFVYHSFLTPFLNSGLLTPKEIISETLKYCEKIQIPIESLEGFIRQILGWREFIRGIYQNYSKIQENENFFNHTGKLSNHWYEGNTGIPPLDHVIKKVIKLGYSHHIERLMVVGSLMLLLEIHPGDAYKWFMEMYIDSSDWVMGPNVYGMAIFSDGGIFATKPYFCGSNYYKKMGGYNNKERWALGVDGLYWRFIEKNKLFFQKNPRLSIIVKGLEKLDPERKKIIYKEADKLIKKLTV